MKTKLIIRKFYMFGVAAIYGISSAHAAIEISDVPLQTGSSVPPNIMFLIDDSGSMHWEVTPDKLRGNDRPSYMFPRANGIYGSNDTNDRVPSFRFTDGSTDDEKITAAYYRTNSINRSYYNPAVTYKPWTKSDGSLFPNANPISAYHHPVRTEKGTRNLTVNNTQSTSWVTCSGEDGVGCSSGGASSRSFYPAVYYRYNGGDKWDISSYEQVEIRPTTLIYSGDGRTAETREDCALGTSCTYAEEIQNFANWYTYSRSRLLSAKGAIGLAFINQSEKVRIGFGSLNNGNTNVDGINSRSIINGVRAFAGEAKDSFYQQLYTRTYPYSGTPLREALAAAGEYYSRTDDRGPWSATPGTTSGGLEEQVECRQSFTVLMTDGVWTNGSISGVGNQDNQNGLAIARPSGDVSDEYTYLPDSPFKDGYADTLADVAMKYWKKDLRPDLENRVPNRGINPAFWQHMVTYGVGFGVDGTIEPDEAFDAIAGNDVIAWPNPLSSTNAKTDDLLHASVNGRGGFFTADDAETFGTKLSVALKAITDTVASGSNLAGTTTSLQSNNFVYQASFNSSDWSGTLKGVSIDDIENSVWESNFPIWDTRRIFFGKRSGTAAVFNPANVTADGNALAGKTDVINYLRGSQALEPINGGDLRERSTLLGDISNSSPAYSGAPVRKSYNRYDFDGSESYLAHLTANANRDPVIFVGANDGMLHAFNAENGMELFAYVPREILTPEADLENYTSQDYFHRYYVDGSPVVADIYDGTSWKTIMVGSLGRGGSSLFAFDVNNPNTFSASNVLWDKTIPELGVITTKPVVARLNNGRWAVIAGFGYNNSTNRSGLIVVDALTGTVTKVIETSSLYNVGDNGTSQVEGWDTNSDGNTDWFFAGDLQGNVWKYDLSSTNTGDWGVAYSGAPLFTASDSSGNTQSITGGVSLASDPKSGALWIFFGTGRMLTEEDPLLNTQESWYGIKDGNVISGRDQLKSRDVTNVSYSGIIQSREVSANEPGDMTDKLGWVIDLIDDRERMVTSPIVVGTSLISNTIIPDNSSCNPEGDGWVMAIDPFTGARLNNHFFDFNGDRKFDSEDGITTAQIPASGLKFDSMTSSPLIFEDPEGEGSTLITGEAGLGLNSDYVNTGIRRGRVSWRELTN